MRFRYPNLNALHSILPRFGSWLPSRFAGEVALICTVLLVTELLFLPLPGIQGDESLFVTPFLRDATTLFSWEVLGKRIPLMTMSYLGAGKSWLYWPIFRFWPPGVWSIRLPVCIASGVTLLFFANLIRRTTSDSIALCATLLLATDALFVLIDVFDMTVCLLLLGTIAFLNLLHHFKTSSRIACLAGAFLVAGMTVWYKAIFIFPLTGMLSATLLVFPQQLRRYLTTRHLLVALISFAVGASPLIAFNVARPGATFKASADLPGTPIAEKLTMMRRTLDGRAMEHYMFRSSFDEKIPLRGASSAELVFAWYRQSRLRLGSALLPALLLALLALPFLTGAALFRSILFAWVAFAVTFGLMLALGDAGAGPHHAILVYPAPHFIVSATAATLAWRMRAKPACTLGILCLLVAGSNAWLLRGYYSTARSNGFSVFWTDAIAPLANRLRSEQLPVVLLDWGFGNGVNIEAQDALLTSEDPTPRENTLYVTHCDDYVIDETRMKRFESLLQASDLQITGEHTVSDRQGRPIFRLFRLVRSAKD